tara:strand:+ start:104 stop:538 length:435 start_codon:yes stop_codon:yes gene_type:complete
MPSDKLSQLYDNNIIEHSTKPRNNTVLSNETHSGYSINPFCGDEVRVQLLVKNGFISKVGIQTIGCKINIAAASLLSETLINESIKKIPKLENLFVEYLNNKNHGNSYCELNSLLKLSQVRNFPIRIKCALLPWSALQDAIQEK